MSKKNSEKEIEEAQQKVREEAKPEQKKESSEKKESKKEESVEKTLTQEERELQEQKPRKETDLEDIARGNQPPALPTELHDSQYVKELSHKPMMEIYNEIKDIYKTVEDKGYLSPVQQKQIEYFNSAVQRKLEDEEHGTYSLSEQAARAASVSQQLSASMMGSYKGKKSNEMYRY